MLKAFNNSDFSPLISSALRHHVTRQYLGVNTPKDLTVLLKLFTQLPQQNLPPQKKLLEYKPTTKINNDQTEQALLARLGELERTNEYKKLTAPDKSLFIGTINNYALKFPGKSKEFVYGLFYSYLIHLLKDRTRYSFPEYWDNKHFYSIAKAINK